MDTRRDDVEPEIEPTGRPAGDSGVSPAARRIVVAVAVAALVLVGLTIWVVLVPYPEADLAGLPSCESTVDWVDDAAGRASQDKWEQACAQEDEAPSDRLTTALLIGAGVATAAAAVSTWPSRRLTGEALGPLR